MLGIPLDPLLALAFDIGCDAVMIDFEIECQERAKENPQQANVSAHELFDML